jgi:DNA-binding NtrC family response regulator
MKMQKAGNMNVQQADHFQKVRPTWAGDKDLYIAMLTDTNVLLTGPADAALAAARRIHRESGWRHGPFIVVDCREPDELERRVADAFWGRPHASEDAMVRLLQAGTVFLHEVARTPARLQKTLDDQLVQLCGRGRSRRRVLASSSESLMQRVLDGTFDARLFYRLNVIHLAVPALVR